MSQLLKMQGLGNSFVVTQAKYEISPEYIQKTCKQAGVDGFLKVEPINRSTVAMRYWNADGSEAEMCGNGLRCVARFAVDHKLVDPGEFTVNTKAGKLKAIWDGKDHTQIEVQVGRPKVTTEPMFIEDNCFYYVDVGNPHVDTFVQDVDNEPVTSIGALIENNKNFPNKTNVGFIQVISPQKIKVRVWERGVGETLSCGTGMVAAARLSNAIMKTELPVTVEVRGGEAQVWLDDEGYCRMRGPAEIISSE